jgi:hypothetical protein
MQAKYKRCVIFAEQSQFMVYSDVTRRLLFFGLYLHSFMLVFNVEMFVERCVVDCLTSFQFVSLILRALHFVRNVGGTEFVRGIGAE